MKEAFGGIFSIMFIAIFLVIVIGILGLVVSYTKAFQMKNIVISTIERYEGSCCGGGNETGSGETALIKCQPTRSACRRSIAEQARGLGYNPVSLNCHDYSLAQSEDGKDLFCYKITKTRNEDGKQYVYYTIVTQVDIHFPIIREIFGIKIFQVSGDTREIQLQEKWW